MLTSCAARENVRLQPGAGLTLPSSQPRFIIEQKTRSVQSLVSCGNDFVHGGCSKTLIFSIVVEEGAILTGGNINYTAINHTAPPQELPQKGSSNPSQLPWHDWIWHPCFLPSITTQIITFYIKTKRYQHILAAGASLFFREFCPKPILPPDSAVRAAAFTAWQRRAGKRFPAWEGSVPTSKWVCRRAGELLRGQHVRSEGPGAITACLARPAPTKDPSAGCSRTTRSRTGGTTASEKSKCTQVHGVSPQKNPINHSVLQHTSPDVRLYCCAAFVGLEGKIPPKPPRSCCPLCC